MAVWLEKHAAMIITRHRNYRFVHLRTRVRKTIGSLTKEAVVVKRKVYESVTFLDEPWGIQSMRRMRTTGRLTSAFDTIGC